MIDLLTKHPMFLLALLLHSVFSFDRVLAYGDDEKLPPEVNKNFVTIKRLTSLGRYAEAIEVFDLTIDAYPEMGLLYAGRGAMLQLIGHDSMAEKDLSRAIDLKMNSPSVFMARGGSRHELRDYEGAMTDLSVAIALDDELTEAFFMRACLFFQLQEFDRATLDLDKVILRDDKNYEAIILRARCRIETQKFDGAIDDANKASELKPQESTPSYIRDRALAEKSVYWTSQHDYNKASNMDPQSDRKNVKDDQIDTSQTDLHSFKQNYVTGSVLIILFTLASTYLGFRCCLHH